MAADKTYWNDNGFYQAELAKLQLLIPSEGSVKNPYKNKALEYFRKAANKYYRLYNDGDFNIGAARLFRVEFPSIYKEYYFYSDYRGRTNRASRWRKQLYDMVELRMNEIIHDALVEQKLI